MVSSGSLCMDVRMGWNSDTTVNENSYGATCTCSSKAVSIVCNLKNWDSNNNKALSTNLCPFVLKLNTIYSRSCLLIVGPSEYLDCSSLTAAPVILQYCTKGFVSESCYREWWTFFVGFRWYVDFIECCGLPSTTQRNGSSCAAKSKWFSGAPKIFVSALYTSPSIPSFFPLQCRLSVI